MCARGGGERMEETNPGSAESTPSLDGCGDGGVRGVNIGVDDVDAVSVHECSVRSFLFDNQTR